MLHDLANDGGFVALKQTAEDREGWRHRERMSKPIVQQKTTDDFFLKASRKGRDSRVFDSHCGGPTVGPTHTNSWLTYTMCKHFAD